MNTHIHTITEYKQYIIIILCEYNIPLLPADVIVTPFFSDNKDVCSFLEPLILILFYHFESRK